MLEQIMKELREEDEQYFDDVVKYVQTLDRVSASKLQIRFSWGYNRASRLMQMLEERGIVEKPMAEWQSRKVVK